MKTTKLLLLLSGIIVMSCTAELPDPVNPANRSGEIQQSESDTLKVNTDIGEWNQGTDRQMVGKEKN